MAAKKAPGRLQLVQDFVNTLDVELATDAVATPAALAAWLAERGLLDSAGEGAEAGAHDWALAFREALRALLLANNEEPLAVAAMATINSAARRSGLEPRFAAGRGVRLEPVAGGIEGACGRLLAIVAEAMGDGTWSRLKACSEHTCQYAFYDSSRNRSGHWCSMNVCGNRAKARQFRARRRVRGTSSSI